jgi:hypothetical protein
MRHYTLVKAPQERDGQGWQLPRDVLAWHTLVAKEGCTWDVIDWECVCSTAFVLPIVEDKDKSLRRIYLLDKDPYKMGTYLAVPTSYSSTQSLLKKTWILKKFVALFTWPTRTIWVAITY